MCFVYEKLLSMQSNVNKPYKKFVTSNQKLYPMTRQTGAINV